ncbi:cytochrome c oxidase assembly factor Coa1 family protein [Corallococcus sp. Z5C101001]|uniref:cytochrome c oxidase assembly factor Coa1 family protein n=1 Tax=Corallococcus sp. Z5C101001 TaxID=2596829 RepID=UPI00163D9D52|nr:cytochrome c oxidase assembly factor Coa1 family protein [Corallococcus sp. Z5C101001]
MSSTMKWVLAAVLGLPLLCCGGGGLMLLHAWSQLPYSEAMERVENHQGVTQLLGAPVSGSRFFSATFNLQNQDGIAEMKIDLSGSKQDGVLHVKAVRTSDLWGFSQLRVVAKDGRVVNVVGERL